MRCPGSHTAPYAVAPRNRRYIMADSRGVCRYCGREYYVLGNGTLHQHQGLPMEDNSCPYRCPGPECDFACYFPQEAAVGEPS